MPLPMEGRSLAITCSISRSCRGLQDLRGDELGGAQEELPHGVPVHGSAGGEVVLQDDAPWCKELEGLLGVALAHARVEEDEVERAAFRQHVLPPPEHDL